MEIPYCKESEKSEESPLSARLQLALWQTLPFEGALLLNLGGYPGPMFWIRIRSAGRRTKTLEALGIGPANAPAALARFTWRSVSSFSDQEGIMMSSAWEELTDESSS